MKEEEDLKKEIEKEFLGIRGWKNWEEYDKIQESSELDKNIRKELINISIEKAEQIFLEMIDEFDFNFYVEDEQVAELKYLLKSKINNGK